MKVSIIIPAYNEEKYIENTLKSIKSQNFKDYEIIVVCNGCTDKTSKIAKKYANKVLEIKERNVSLARNKGAEIASNQLLLFLDADIELPKDTIEKIVNSNFKLGTCKSIPNSKNVMAKLLSIIKNITHHISFYTGLIFIDKETFKKTNGFNINLKIREGHDFIKKAKRYEKYHIVNSYIINNMRRFEKKGYFNLTIFWIKTLFIKPKEYEAIR